MDQDTMFARLAGLLPDGGTDDLAFGVDAVVPADVDRLRRAARPRRLG
jgi:hypothetical protein